MRFLSAMAAFGLLAAAAAAGEQPAKGGKATVQLVGKLEADKDTTLNYTLKKGTKVVAEGKGVSSLPAKGVEVDAADAAGPFELTLSATGGAARVSGAGVVVTSGGKTSKGTFGGPTIALNTSDGFGTLRSVTVGITPAPVATKTEEPKKKVDEPKKIEEPKKKVDEPKKKVDEPKKTTDAPKKTDDTKKKTTTDDTKKKATTDDTKKSDDTKKKTDDAKKLPPAPAPRSK